MPAEIKEARLVDAKIFVGPQLERLRGAGDGDYFSIALGGDTGSAVSGVQGDVMLVQRLQNLYVATHTFIGASRAVAAILEQYETGVAFLYKASYNDFTITAWANVGSVGEWVASAGTLSRTMVLNLAKISGNTAASVGRTLQVGT
jgi:hypothetical protein